MPEVDGRVLGHPVARTWPELPLLYISAYPADDLFPPVVPPTAAAPFMQKPIIAEELLTVVQGLLTSRGVT